jgi:hypothetical protein
MSYIKAVHLYSYDDTTQSSSSRFRFCIFTPTLTTFLYSSSPGSAVSNMILPITEGMPSSYRNRHDHHVQLQAAGHDLAHPIVIDSDNEDDIGPSAPTARHSPQPHKYTLPRRKKRRTQRSSLSYSPSQNSPDVFYPDLSAKVQRSEDDINATLSQEQLDHQLAQRLQQQEDVSGPTMGQDQTDLAQPTPYVTVATRECLVCGDSSPIAELPKLAECKHLPQTCSTCYAGWIAAQLQESSWREAKCPESRCHVKMTYNEIQ